MNKLLAIIFLLCFALVQAQNERGVLPVRHFTQKEFKSQVQNFAVAQDKNGVVYFGNKEGLLEYRGDFWRKHLLNNRMEVKSLAVDSLGKVYVGGNGEFGYFFIDSNNIGKGLQYKCLSCLLDSSFSNIKAIKNIEIVGSNVYFSASTHLFQWDGKKLIIINGDHKFIHLISNQGNLYSFMNDLGMIKIVGNNLVPVRGGEKLLRLETEEMLSDEDTSKMKVSFTMITSLGNNDFMVYFEKEHKFGMITINGGNLQVKPFATGIDAFLDGFQVTSMQYLGKGKIAVALDRKGVYILDLSGKISQNINTFNGLEEGMIMSMKLDLQNQLWVCTSQGISRVNMNSSKENFPSKKFGYSGIIEKLETFGGKIYIGSYNGLFYSSFNDLTNSNKPTDVIEKTTFVKHTDSLFQKSIWSLKTFKVTDGELLLVITDDALVMIDKNNKAHHIAEAFAWTIHIDKIDQNRIWVGLDNGLTSLYYKDGKFEIEGRVPGFQKDARFIEQDLQGNIWVSNVDYIAKIAKPVFVDHKIATPDIKFYNTLNGLTKDVTILPRLIDGQIYLCTDIGIFQIEPKTNKIVRSLNFGEWFTDTVAKHTAHRVIQDSRGNVWVVTKSADEEQLFLYKITKGSNGKYEDYDLIYSEKGKGAIINEIFEAENNLFWFGGTTELVKFADLEEVDTTHFFNLFINLVTSGNDTIFRGFDIVNGIVNINQNADLPIVVDYKNNTFYFQFSAIAKNDQEPILYSYMLEGFDDNWSSWDVNGFIRFTNLPEGDYVFKVRAKDGYENISEPVTYTFSITPPWYRTIIAYITYFILFVAFVWGAISVSTRSLKKIIKEATAEIQAQKDELEEKNQNILDSIRYAKRIQEAVTPSETQMTKYFPEHFVLWRPRDIVSGDFYWMINKEGKTVVAAADCTGHGVPGAFMSIMGISFLNQIANMPEVQTASDALDHLRHNVITSLNKEGSETDTKDGMDISLCVYDFENMLMQFSGAYNPLYMIRDGQIDTIKADRMPVGVHDRMDTPFTNNVFTMKKGDLYYILSDGYIDQFGGPDGKKLMTKRFKEILLEVHKKPMAEQCRLLEEELIKWRGEIEQVDDIIVIGIKVV